MEKEDKSNMVIIGDKEYKIEDFTKEQNYHVSQIKDLQNKAINFKFQLDQVTTAEKAFTSFLLKSLTNEEKTPDDKNTNDIKKKI
jgi:hypothetical protein